MITDLVNITKIPAEAEASDDNDAEDDIEDDTSIENDTEDDIEDDTEAVDTDSDDMADSFPRAHVESLRKENGKRRKQVAEYKQKLSSAQAEIDALKREQRKEQTVKKKVVEVDSRLSDEVEQLRATLKKVTDERDRFRVAQEEGSRVMTVTTIARNLGFADEHDALLLINDQIDELVDDKGDLDADTVQNVLRELLDSKPYLAGAQVQQDAEQAAVRKKKSRAEAARTDNPPSEASIKAPSVKTGDSETEQVIKDEITTLARQGDGRAALRLKIHKQWLPQLQKESRYARMS